MENSRKNFLKLTGLGSPASLIPLSVFSEEAEADQQPASCTYPEITIKGSSITTGQEKTEKHPEDPGCFSE
jgi:hypothetical protein